MKTIPKKKDILIVSNSLSGLKNFRWELIQELSNKFNKIIVVCPKDYILKVKNFSNIQFEYVNISRRSVNPIKNILLFLRYLFIFVKYNPKIVLSFTIKPNIYTGIISRILKVNHIPTITGLGTTFQSKTPLRMVIILMYRIAFKKSKFIFFQNQHNFDLFNQFKLPVNNAILVNGSGVSLNKFSCLKVENKRFNEIDIYFIGRIMKSKGIDLFLKAARYIKKNHSNVKFHVIGRYDGNYEKLMESYIVDKTIKYHGEVKNVKDHYKKSDLVILPSYHEGLSNVILESAASCRPVIASNIPGCKEIVEHNKSGYLFSLGNQEELCFYIEKFLKLSLYERISMGKHGRNIIESKFNRKIVTESYLKVIKSI